MIKETKIAGFQFGDLKIKLLKVGDTYKLVKNRRVVCSRTSYNLIILDMFNLIYKEVYQLKIEYSSKI